MAGRESEGKREGERQKYRDRQRETEREKDREKEIRQRKILKGEGFEVKTHFRWKNSSGQFSNVEKFLVLLALGPINK